MMDPDERSQASIKKCPNAEPAYMRKWLYEGKQVVDLSYINENTEKLCCVSNQEVQEWN